jgi:NAD-dependent deacetylase
MPLAANPPPLRKLVVLSGAGVSVESGLETFRGTGGLWEGRRVEDVASPGGWARDPEGVLDFYNQRRRAVAGAVPNGAHLGIASLERRYRVTVITQNIDDLHERAGSHHVLHLHGEIFKMRGSLDADAVYPVTGDIRPGDMAPDGTQLRPAVVWFSEPVPMIEPAAEYTSQADVVVVIGTSLNVYPAAGLLDVADPRAPIYVIDPHLPRLAYSDRVHPIEMPATLGVRRLLELLGAED